LHLFSKLLDWLSRAVIAAASIALVALVVIMGWMVFGRYVLNDTPTWVERAATLAIVSIALPVAAVGVRERFHLAVLGFREALPDRPRWSVEIVCDILVGLFGLAMLYWSWDLLATSAGIRIPLLGISQAWSYAPVTLSGGMIVLFSIEQTLLGLKHQRTAQRAGAYLE
jgi:TRAP-type C4-dicarboxylate transport system permease small subunit